MGTRKPVGRPLSAGSWLSDSCGLGHAHRQVAVAQALEFVERLGGLTGKVDAVCAIDPRGDARDPLLQGRVVARQEAEGVAVVLRGLPDGARQVLGARAAALEMISDHRGMRPGRERHLLDDGNLGGLVGRERVDRDDRRNAVAAHDRDVLREVVAAPADAVRIFSSQRLDRAACRPRRGPRRRAS